MTEIAKYPLSEVFTLVMEGKYWFPAPSRSFLIVQGLYSETPKAKSTIEAKQFILAGILSLKPENFYKRQMQWGVIVDIYGLIFDDMPWFVKFAIAPAENDDGFEESFLQEISFHPPERSFVTRGGIKL